MDRYDVIVAGAGSIGTPTAMALGRKGFKTLVIDFKPSTGQGENKHAIGGIRATHSTPGKILTCMRSLEIFSTWEETYGHNIEWLQGGYAYPVYRKADETLLTGMIPTQKQSGLSIDYVTADRMRDIVPGINPDGLRGGTYSPGDGSASPLLAGTAFYREAVAAGVAFRFNEKIVSILTDGGRVTGVATDQSRYIAPVVIDAAGPFSPELCATVGIDMPVTPDSHEGAITEPVQMFSPCMVVDIRPMPGSKNYYFYQNRHGQIVFCITPDPPIVGFDKRETSTFLPQVCALMVTLIPRLKNLRVRRVWRGLYPQTPDGSPIVGWNQEVTGLLHAAGMCGQGFMLGPGLAEIITRMVSEETTNDDRIVLDEFSPYRAYSKEEALK